MLQDVRPIQIDNVPLARIHCGQVMRFDELLHGLRHASDDQVLPKHIHNATMQGCANRNNVLVTFCNDRQESRIPRGPKEFLEIHRIHFQPMFFTGNDDVPYVLVD